jgi:hypothetical protein
MRHIFYKVKLVTEDAKELLITIATPYIERIEPLVERNKVLYLARGFKVARFEIVDTRYSFNMPQPVYEQEVAFCDIVDEPDGDATGPATVVKSFTR